MLQLLQAGASRSFASLDDHRPWQDAAAERRRAPSLARARVRPSGPSSCYKDRRFHIVVMLHTMRAPLHYDTVGSSTSARRRIRRDRAVCVAIGIARSTFARLAHKFSHTRSPPAVPAPFARSTSTTSSIPPASSDLPPPRGSIL